MQGKASQMWPCWTGVGTWNILSNAIFLSWPIVPFGDFLIGFVTLEVTPSQVLSRPKWPPHRFCHARSDPLTGFVTPEVTPSQVLSRPQWPPHRFCHARSDPLTGFVTPEVTPLQVLSRPKWTPHTGSSWQALMTAHLALAYHFHMLLLFVASVVQLLVFHDVAFVWPLFKFYLFILLSFEPPSGWEWFEMSNTNASYIREFIAKRYVSVFICWLRPNVLWFVAHVHNSRCILVDLLWWQRQ